jgi:cytosine/adenosine deaminase-related metal-dependent hydrolase
MIKALINVTYYDFDVFRENCYILYDQEIIEIGAMETYVKKTDSVIDCFGQIVMPSLVLGHTHIYSTFARGLALPFHPQTFTELLEQLWWRIDAGLDNETTYQSGVYAGGEFLKNGVTTIIDHHASGKEIKGSLEMLCKAVVEEGFMRGIFCFETSDRFDIPSCIAENQQFLSQKPSHFHAGMFGLHASMTLSEDTLRAVKAVLGNHPIHIHLAESLEDETDSLAKYGERIVKRLDRHGLLNPGSILSHAIHTDASELALIKKRGCSIAVNVTSNMNNGVGLPDLKTFREMGITTIIGNDGISFSAAAEYQNLFFSAHLKNGVNEFSLSDLQRMINDTYDFAGNLLGIKIGKIRPGYQADLLSIPYIAPTPIDSANALGHLFFGLLPGFKPKNVFVAGKQLVTNYQLLPILEEKSQQVFPVAQRLWENVRKDG